MRERWELGVQNGSAAVPGDSEARLLRRRHLSQGLVSPWRSEGRERAFVRFVTAPGEQAQMDWGHFGNYGDKRLYGFALTLCWSRMQYVEFAQRQDAETLSNCMLHALTYFGGVPQTVLTDNMKRVIVDRIDGQPRFHARLLDFASYYGFVPRVCRPYRPQMKEKI
jgi:transposase